jgi:hypothetical protein
MALTTYVMLRQSKDDKDVDFGWHRLSGTVEAASADAAIKATAAGTPVALYVAVPLRSWSPSEAGDETRQMTILRRVDA